MHEVEIHTLNIMNKPTKPKLPQTGDNMNSWLYVGIGLAAIIVGVLISFKRKKK